MQRRAITSRIMSHIRVLSFLATASTLAVLPTLASAAITADDLSTQLSLYRAKVGCQPIKVAEPIMRALEAHVADMQVHDFVGSEGSDGSSSADRLQREGYRFKFAAETFQPIKGKTAEEQVAIWWQNPNMQGMFAQCQYEEMGAVIDSQHQIWALIIAIPVTSSIPTIDPTPPSSGGTSPASASTELEQSRLEVLRLTNIERQKVACPALTLNDKVNTAAQKHSEDMLKNNFFDHTGSDGSNVGQRLQREGYRFRMWAENIAAGQRSPTEVVSGWMNSPGHRANILNCSLREMGLGLTRVTSGSSYTTTYGTYWTQDFATPY